MSTFKLSKDSLANVYLFYGEENYKKRLYRDQLKKLVTGGNDMNYSYFEGNSIDFNAVYDSVVTLPFFSDKRLVVVENSGKFKSKAQKGAEESDEESKEESGDALLLKILEDLPDSTCLAFFEETAAKNKKTYKLIKEKGTIIECGADTDGDVISWLSKGFAQAGKKANRGALQLLVDRVGTDYDKLRREYEKILGYIGDHPEVTEEDVLAISSEDVESKIFDMLGAMGRKDVKRVLEKYNDLLVNREHPLYILVMLRIQFRTLLQTAELRNKGYTTQDVARILKKRDFVIRNAEGYLRGGFKMKDVRDILDEISETDRKIKSGDLNEQVGVEMLLVKFST
ncbi:MAG: DNA polymerase III subunit delta [Lachnospiraceae bacterium]|nr:DNA polymerase III subunit delta [Lachnospiraceae bacterium]